MEKAILIINDKEIEVQINVGDTKNHGIQIIMDEKTIEKLGEDYEGLFKKKTGYEKEDKYYTIISSGAIRQEVNYHDIIDKERYEGANYYSSETVVKNNARADKLMRQLRRFAVEHRKSKINWNNEDQAKYSIIYNHYSKKITPLPMYTCQDVGSVYFDSKENAQLAINTFYNELTWYFTEYKDSL